MRNPYIAGRWVSGPEFYGRQALVEDILHGPDDHLWVMGLRRTGKTSLLRQTELLSRQDDPYLPLFWDMQGCHAPDDLALALYEGVEEATACFAVLGVDVSAWEGQDLFALLGALARLAQEKERCLLLLVDEAECLNYLARDYPPALQRLRRVLQRGPHVRTVLASSKRLGALHELCRDWETSPFLHGFALHYLGGLESEESTALIRQHQAARPVRAAPGLVAQVRELTGDHPYLLQLLCSRLFSVGSLRPVTDDDLAFVDAQMAGFLLNDFAALADPERAILRALSSGQPLPTGTDPAYLHGLTALGILRREGAGYTVGNAFFARWLREQADWEAKPEVSAESTLAVYTQAEPEKALTGTEEQAVRLRRVLVARFDKSEVRTLCFEMGIESDNLPGETREALARELVAHCVRHGQISKLVEVGKRLRPDILWEGNRSVG